MKLNKGDVGYITEFEFDAIVCDPPYGISTTTAGEEINDLMKRTMDAFSKSTKKEKELLWQSQILVLFQLNHSQLSKHLNGIHKIADKKFISLREKLVPYSTSIV